MEKNLVREVLSDFCNNYNKQKYEIYSESDIECILYNMLKRRLDSKNEKIFREYNQVIINEPYFFTKSFIGDNPISKLFVPFSNYFFLSNSIKNNPNSKEYLEILNLAKNKKREKKFCDIAITENNKEKDKQITKSTFNKYKLIIELKYEPSSERMINGSILMKQRRFDKRSILKDLIIQKLLKLENKDVDFLFVFFNERNHSYYKDFNDKDFLVKYLGTDMEYITKGIEFEQFEIQAYECTEKGTCYFCFI